MNNTNNIYFDYIGATGTGITTDYIDTQIYNTSNILESHIYETSNILHTYTDDSIIILDNKYNKLIKEETEGILKHTYITNSNISGEIRFITKFDTDDYRYKTRIKTNGEIEVYYPDFNPVYPTMFPGWYNVMGSIRDAYNYQNIATELIGGSLIAINDIYKKYYGLVAATGATFGQLTAQQLTKEKFAEIVIGASKAVKYNRFSETQAILGITALGVAGIAASIFNGVAYDTSVRHILYDLSNLDLNIYSNIVQTEKDTALTNLINDGNANIIETNSHLRNLNILNGFIASNVATAQIIPNINTSTITINNTGSATYSLINFSNTTNNSSGYIGLGGIVSGYHNNNMLYNTPKAHIFNVPGQSSLSIPAFSINASACVGININPSAYPLYRFSVDGDVYIHNAALRTNSIIYNGTEISSTLNNYVLKSGSTMTGALTTNSIIYNSQELSTTLNNYLLLSGGTLTDTLLFNTGLYANPGPYPNGFDGDRIVLQTGIGTNGYPYSIGINTDVFWNCAPASASYKWYSGATNTATLDNTGLLTLPSITTTADLAVNGKSQLLGYSVIGYPYFDFEAYSSASIFTTKSINLILKNETATEGGGIIVMNNIGSNASIAIGGTSATPTILRNNLYLLSQNGILLNTGNNTTETPNIIILSNGNIGIGTSNPPSKLYVNGTTTMTGQLAITANSASSLISLTNTHTIGQGILQTNNLGGYARLTYYNSGAGGYYTGNYVLEASSNSAAIIMNTGGNISNSIPRFILNSSGNIGIGISNPSAKLEVNGRIGCIGILNCWSNVGIGVTDPYTQFHMRGTNPILTIMSQGGTGATSTINLSPYDTAANAGACSLVATDAGSFGATFQIRQKLAGANTNGQFTSFIMNVDGNVGIGSTTVAGIKFYVNGKARISDIIILANSLWHQSADGIDRFYYNPNGTSFFHSGNSDPAFVFRSFAQADIVTISNSGNIAGNAGTFGGNIDCGGCLFLTGSNSIYNPGGASVDSGNYSNTYLTFKANVAGNDWCHIRQVGSDNFFKLALDFHDDGDDARFCIRNVKSTDTPDTITEVFSVNNGNVACTGNLIVNDITRSRNYFNFGTTLNYQASYNGYNAGGWYFPLNQFWDGYSTVSYIHIAITCLGINAVWAGRALVGQGGGLYFLTNEFRNPTGTNQIDVYDIWGGSYNALRITINNGTYGGQFNIKISG